MAVLACDTCDAPALVLPPSRLMAADVETRERRPIPSAPPEKERDLHERGRLIRAHRGVVRVLMVCVANLARHPVVDDVLAMIAGHWWVPVTRRAVPHLRFVVARRRTVAPWAVPRNPLRPSDLDEP